MEFSRGWAVRVAVCLRVRPTRQQRLRGTSSASHNLGAQAPLEPDSPSASRRAVVVDDRLQLTYGQLGLLVGRYASLLNSKFRLQRGDRVLARLEKSVHSMALYLATLRVGSIYVPLNPAFTAHEMEHFVKDAEPRLLVTCKSEVDERFSTTVPHVVDALALKLQSENATPEMGVESVSEEDIASICYTSGTTGLPKGAMLSHGNLIWNAKSLINVWRFGPSDVLLHYLPFYHVHGMFISLNCAFLTQSSVIFRTKFSVDDALKWIPRSTVMMGVPTYYSRLIQSSEFTAAVAKNVRLFVSGSAPMSLRLWWDFRERTGKAILERYGMTEAAVITSDEYEVNRRSPGSVGKMLPGGEMRVSDSGVVEIRMPSVFRGYWRNPAKTRADFTSDGFFVTGDVGRIDDKGTLWLLGRAKDLVISGGMNVYPKEIEDSLDAHPSIAESAAIGVPHADFGEAVVAVCCLKAGFSADQVESLLLAHLRARLAPYKIPKRVLFIKELPRNSMGKVKKNRLRETYKKLFALS